MNATPREPRVPVGLLREAARRAVDASSSHQVAGQIGMSAPGLRKFIAGSDPHPATLKKLAEWYVRHSVSTHQIDPDTVAAALTILVDGLPETEQASIRRTVLELLREAHGRLGTKPPVWLSEG